MFYDLHTHTMASIGENTVHDMAEFAKKLGLSGIGVVQYHGTPHHEMEKTNIVDLVRCTMLKPNNAGELSEMAAKAREKCEILMVHGGDYDINRAACENSMIDVICHPELGRKDSGLDHICIKAAQENEVMIEVNFREILESYRKNRTYVLSAMRKNIKLARKYEAKILTTSGAVTKWGLRSGRELAAISYILGLELGKSIESVSGLPEGVVKKNREKLAGKRWQGAHIVDEAE